MFEDEVVAEVRKARDAYAKKFDYDIDRIFEDIKKQEANSGRKLVRMPASKKRKVAKTRRTDKK